MRMITAVGLVLALTLAGCGDRAKLPLSAGMGPMPELPPPNPTLFPTLKIAAARGWPAGAAPTPAPGLAVTAFATGLDHPRWLAVLPNGDVLVAETGAPPKPRDSQSIKGFFMKLFMKKAGSGHPSANRITLLRDADGDGIAELRTVFLANLRSPFGMALIGMDLFVANTDSVVRYPYRAGETEITEQPVKLLDLPAGPRNHHWTKSLVASSDGARLYVGVGSNSNVAEHGMGEEEGRAAIWEINAKTGQYRVFASGLRNPVGLSFEPSSGRLWVAVNERDELGSDIVPDYMTAVVDGGFYGWPFSYFGHHVDKRAEPQRPDLVQRAVMPDYALGPHTASLGLTFGTLPGLGAGAFIGQHGSWNRNPPSGYKVIFVRFERGRPVGSPTDVLAGFLGAKGDALGRPVGVAFDTRGALLVADDVGNSVWRVAGAAQPQTGTP